MSVDIIKGQLEPSLNSKIATRRTRVEEVGERTKPPDNMEDDIAYDKYPVVNPDEQEVKTVVGQLNDVIRAFNTKIKFDIDEKTDQIIVKIIDAETQEVIRQIPPPELLNIAARIEEMSGLLFNQEG